MMKTIEQKLSEAYAANFDIIADGFPDRLNAARGGFMENFMLDGLPDAGDERFSHNDLREVFGREDFEMYFTRPRFSERFMPLETEDEPVVTENGFFYGAAFEQRTDGVVCGSLKKMLSASEAFASYYNSVAENSSDSLTALNSALAQDGVAVYVPDGVDAGKIIIDNRFCSDEASLLCFGRTLVVLGERASADISVVYRNSGTTRFIVDSVREIILGNSSHLRLSEINLMDKNCQLIQNSYQKQSDGSSARNVFAALGAGDARMGMRTELVGPHAEYELFGTYIAAEHQCTDIEVNVRHMVEDCRSRQLVKGIAADESVGIFRGLVYVARDAQRTDAAQQNRNIQLHDTAKVYTRPQLEIYADDVKCGHGATVGQLNEEEVYYMRQRGVAEHDARRMQMEGFINDIVEKSSSDMFRKYASRQSVEALRKM